MQRSLNATSGRSVTLAILSVFLFGLSSCSDGPGPKDIENDFAGQFPKGEFQREGERGIRTTGLPDGFHERGKTTDGRYWFVRTWTEEGDVELVECSDTNESIEYTFFCGEGLLHIREYTDMRSGRRILHEIVHYGADPRKSLVFCEIGSCRDWPLPFSRIEFCKDLRPIETKVSEAVCEQLNRN